MIFSFFGTKRKPWNLSTSLLPALSSSWEQEWYWCHWITLWCCLCSFQIAMWLISWWKPIPVVVILSKMFFAGFSSPKTGKIIYNSSSCIGDHASNTIILTGVSLFAALGFLLYGGRYVFGLSTAFSNI